MEIVDIFSFNGELDVLEIRLNVLGDVVDQFIICESDETFTGLKKPLYYEENKERYAKWWPKIRTFRMASNDPILARDALNSPGVPKELHWWVREYTQKESMRYALTHLNDDDIVYIGDADEIWNPAHMPPSGRWKLEQTVYAYYLNNRSSEWWEGTQVIPYWMVKKHTLDDLRAHDRHVRSIEKAPTWSNFGWHFTNMYGNNPEKIKEKLNSYSHQEFNFPQITDNIGDKIRNNQDFIGRDFTFTVDETGLPYYVLHNKAKYVHLWKDDTMGG